MIAEGEDIQLPGFARHGQTVAAEQLWARSDAKLEDMDLFYAYDGFTIIALSWFEQLGWCGIGEAGDFLDEHWREDQSRIMINGRVPVNTHGGSLSEGGSQGSGFIREAVQQLRGSAGERQIDGARTALLGVGGFFFNSQAAILRTGG
jgi:acetyl-CoA acetyltransferase